MSLTDAEKRDFVAQMIDLLQQSNETLAGKGFDPSAKIETLTNLSRQAETAEASQQQAMADAKKATVEAQKNLEAAYKEASASVELVTGLLGKDNELVSQLRKIRN
jgi:multidrug efflux pump subunit AcrA (membrane-fusion protein)